MSLLTNSPRRLFPIRLEKAKAFSFEIDFTIANGSPADITGCEVSLVVREPVHAGGLVVLTKTAVLVPAVPGQCRLDLQAAELDLEVGDYEYTVTLLTAESYSAVVCKGPFEILDNTESDWVAEVYAGVNPPTSLTVELQRNNSFTVTLNYVPPPTGAGGPPGADGATGPQGLSAFQVALVNGFVGTEAEWLASLEGPQGEQGIQGIQGESGADGADGLMTVEETLDTVASALVGGTNITVTVDEALDTFTLSSTVRAVNTQTGTSYTLVLADAGKFVTMNNAASSALTVPPNSAVAFPVGTMIEGAQLGAGQVTLTPGSGVTINAVPGLKVDARYGTFGLLKTATDTWLAFGRLAS